MKRELETCVSSGDLARIREQRETAMACAGLALAISVATLISNFSDRTAQIRAVQESVDAHERLLADENRVYDANMKVLQETRAAVDRTKPPRR
jgi:hypothetical protein